MRKTPKTRNEAARALGVRAGTADVAVAVDTRPKAERNRKGYTRKGRAKPEPHSDPEISAS